MKTISFVLTTVILSAHVCFAGDSPCEPFYDELLAIPHSELKLGRDGFVSLLDGKKLKGCQVTFESNQSIVSGVLVYHKFLSLTDRQGWSINQKYQADGAGSSTTVIEDQKHRCIVNWSQPSWIDEETNEYRQSEAIEVIVQCTALQ